MAFCWALSISRGVKWWKRLWLCGELLGLLPCWNVQRWSLQRHLCYCCSGRSLRARLLFFPPFLRNLCPGGPAVTLLAQERDWQLWGGDTAHPATGACQSVHMAWLAYALLKVFRFSWRHSHRCVDVLLSLVLSLQQLLWRLEFGKY